MEPLALIEQAAARYRQLDSLGQAIEQNIQNNELTAAAEISARLDALQEEAKAPDSELFHLLRHHRFLRELDITKEWLQLMQGIQERNQRLMPHIKSIMAMQRSEQQTLQKGNSMLQGYKPTIASTGKRFSSSG
ncbi:MAG: hypothetical protein FWG62_04585 [Proteobacteria bacterium]|nr:hypothetical protein [Pseudomonadota bacterium]